MSSFDRGRVALIVAEPAGDGAAADPKMEVGTGYFLTGNLVLTARHVSGRFGWAFSVRAEVGANEADHWSDAVPCWVGGGDVDAMVLRTAKWFGDWEVPALGGTADGAAWASAGYPRAAVDDGTGDRKGWPLRGTLGMSLGQGPLELILHTEDHMASGWATHRKGISGAAIFSTGPGHEGLIGIIVDASEAVTNAIVGLPATRIFSDVRFRSAITPSFLGDLPSARLCLVLAQEASPPDQGLAEKVKRVVAGFRDEDPFRDLHMTPISVLDAVRSAENWVAVVDALARADYLIADVTSFEPAVMLLLGIRSVLRRGVTVSVTSEDFTTHSATVPFNMRETRIVSCDDDDRFYDDLHRAMADGAVNLVRDPNYLDLPAYQAVRAPRPQTWADDDARSFLVLCPFSTEYSEFYEKRLRPVLRGYTRNMTPQRMLDLRSPRLVGQALYEQIRWATRCLVDWTGWRPNVFFELGVRLACSEHDPLCIIQQGTGESPGEAGLQADGLLQREMLRHLLDPAEYDREHPSSLASALEAWSKPPVLDKQESPSRPALPPAATFEVAQASFRWQRDALLTLPHAEQRQAAELILGKDQERNPERLILFADNDEFDAELRVTVREKWIAAWLYLHHLSTTTDTIDAGTRTELITVGRLVQHALSSSMDPRHIRLRHEIREFLRAERVQRRTRESDNNSG